MGRSRENRVISETCEGGGGTRKGADGPEKEMGAIALVQRPAGLVSHGLPLWPRAEPGPPHVRLRGSGREQSQQLLGPDVPDAGRRTRTRPQRRGEARSEQ